MKTYTKSLGVGLAALLAWTQPAARAQLGISAGVGISAGADVQINTPADFDAPLATVGTWVTVGNYGRCWHPRGVAVNWRPYCNGQWVWTDDGWYWQSDEPWAWACYHYGTWYLDPTYGWVWVPGVEWAPAWVVWRSGGGYVGWAPCAPRGATVDVGLFAFVPTARFDEPVSLASVEINDRVAIGKTTSLGAASHGPAVTDIQRATGRQIRTVPLQQARAQTRVPAEMRQNARPNTERPAPPLNERTLRNEPTAPSRDINPPAKAVSPRSGEETAPRHEENISPRESAPRSEGITPSRPAPAEKALQQGVTKPGASAAPAKPAEQPRPGEGKEEKHEP